MERVAARGEGVEAGTTPHTVKVLVPPAGEDEVGPPLLRVGRGVWRAFAAGV